MRVVQRENEMKREKEADHGGHGGHSEKQGQKTTSPSTRCIKRETKNDLMPFSPCRCG
jgi:hypothetical protein